MMRNGWVAAIAGVGLCAWLAVPVCAQSSSDDQSGNSERNSSSQDRSRSTDDRNDRSSQRDSERSSSAQNNKGQNNKRQDNEGQNQGGIRGFIKRHDQDNDGYLSKSEAPKQMRNDFDSLDRDGDGYLSRQELERHAQEARRAGTTPEEVTYIWVIDADAGQLDLQDLQAAYDSLQKIDKDGDGKITQRELNNRREHVVSQWCDKCFGRLDQNNDGELSRSEAEDTAFAEDFDEIDRNQDGYLTKSEIHRQLEKDFSSQSASREKNSDERRR